MSKKSSNRWSAMQIAQAVVTGLTLLFLFVPVIQMAVTAFMKNAFRGFKAGFTTQWIERVLTNYGDTILRSLGLAVGALVICIIIGVPAAWVLVREQRKRWAGLVEEALLLPLSIPGLAIGLGILLVWGGFGGFRQSSLFILCGHVMFCLPFMVRSVMAVMRVEPLDAYEEASATLGASPWTTFMKVVVPVSMPGILAGGLMVMTVSLGEFNISWMLQTPDTKTLPVGMADSYASLRLEIGSAYTFLFFVILVPLLSLMQSLPEWLAKKRAERRRKAALAAEDEALQ
ncbi:ABC transporter permease [Sutterella massiliensis]|uniref:ABC transporter permease n=1 Tax=Sutterella massiliensis TaxID=1816689 RepID=A0ABS2DRR6_9BURK|nr:ABC transporter permease [Sutterella massiliensis]MBM6704017.1 ABC transporter permease [Sutterella massiliensis]